jgi:hypothetical protein
MKWERGHPARNPRRSLGGLNWRTERPSLSAQQAAPPQL